ncbi:HNH endonuclease [Natrinema sp. H-ect4]|uniref:HNH endonuclease n=1 Tax=Natrinema sp. H-ect4 TaxID=3242699 RepID=UPI0035A90118
MKVGELFPQVEEGKCAVCPNEIPEDSRKRRYCSDRCKEVAYATQKLYTWKKVRERVMEKRDHVCKVCGYDKERFDELCEKVREEEDISHRHHVIQRVEEKYDIEHRKMELDHIHPVSKGGAMFDEDNLQITCAPCNREKSDKWRGEPNVFDFFDDTDKTARTENGDTASE